MARRRGGARRLEYVAWSRHATGMPRVRRGQLDRHTASQPCRVDDQRRHLTPCPTQPGLSHGARLRDRSHGRRRRHDTEWATAPLHTVRGPVLRNPTVWAAASEAPRSYATTGPPTMSSTSRRVEGDQDMRAPRAGRPSTGSNERERRTRRLQEVETQVLIIGFRSPLADGHAAESVVEPLRVASCSPGESQSRGRRTSPPDLGTPQTAAVGGWVWRPGEPHGRGV